MNGIGIIARDHDGKFLWGVMGPLKGLEGFKSQACTVHLALKIAFQRSITHVHIECDNVVMFDMLVEQDEELEEKGLTLAVQQINVLSSEYNCTTSLVWPLLSKKVAAFTLYLPQEKEPPAYMVEYSLRYCSNLVEVTSPFGSLSEILEIDNGLGPHWPIFDILPNFGHGESVHTPATTLIVSSNFHQSADASVTNSFIEDLVNDMLQSYSP